MPTGWYQVREKKNDFRKLTKYSQQAIQWMEHIMEIENIHIRHAENCVHGENVYKIIVLMGSVKKQTRFTNSSDVSITDIVCTMIPRKFWRHISENLLLRSRL